MHIEFVFTISNMQNLTVDGGILEVQYYVRFRCTSIYYEEACTGYTITTIANEQTILRIYELHRTESESKASVFGTYTTTTVY